MRAIFFIISVLSFTILNAQNYGNVFVKEEYDLYNKTMVYNTSYNPCTADPNNDQGTFGDGMAKVLEGYIPVYKATKDKAYLYKFVLQSLCMMENRHDFAGINSQPRW